MENKIITPKLVLSVDRPKGVGKSVNKLVNKSIRNSVRTSLTFTTYGSVDKSVWSSAYNPVLELINNSTRWRIEL